MRNLFLIIIKRNLQVTLCLQSSNNNPNAFNAQEHLLCSYFINLLACYRGELMINSYISYVVRYFLTDALVHLRSNCKPNWKVKGVKSFNDELRVETSYLIKNTWTPQGALKLVIWCTWILFFIHENIEIVL